METSYPEGWHKTLEDLRGEKRRYTGEEMRWARSYERDKSIDIADLSKGGKIKLSPRDLKGKRLDGNNNSAIENVFRESGRYEIYVADNIDTEHENALSAKLAFIYSREVR